MATAHAGLRSRPWVQAWPVARLQSFKHDVDLIVLDGMTGSTLAFGPGHLTGSALPGYAGHSVIGGDRDRYFGFLEKLQVGDRILVERNDGREFWFRVNLAGTAGRDRRPDRSGPDSMLWLLGYCPFETAEPDSRPGYVVSARPLPVHDRSARSVQRAV